MSVQAESLAIARRAEAAIPACFEAMVAHFSDQVALSSSDRTYTYDELDRAANRVAHAIMERSSGAEPQAVVLLAERSHWGVVGLLAILKAGKFCVPIRPSNNEDRMLEAVLAEMQRPLVVTHGAWVEHVRHLASARHVVDVESPGPFLTDRSTGLAPGPDDLAFVIYTSGSTGTPKGVMHSHRNILHRIFWYAARFGVGASDQTMMLSSADHISGIVGMLRSLLTGGRLHIFDICTDGFHGLARELYQQRVTILPIVNTVFRRFIDSLACEGQFPDLRLVILGGEPLLKGDVDRYRRHFSDACLLLNTLGCTELPTYRYWIIDKHSAVADGTIPAGHAVPGITVDIIDPEGNRVPDGASGEIRVRSRYLAFGYWNRPTETTDRFAILDNGERSFRTGDLGRMREDGALIHLGRDDWMIKILGNRVELTEVEDVIRRHPLVCDAAVTTWPDETGERRLYAYIVSEPNAQLAGTAIKDFVRAQLPDYMVPFDVVCLNELPLTRSGKLDRRALPAPSSNRHESRETLARPRDELELKLVRVWEDVLKVSPIGLHDNFFDLGGQSLLAVSLLSRIEKTFNRKLSPVTLFRAPTVEKLAEALRSEGGASSPWYSLVPLQVGGSRPLLFSVHYIHYHDLVRHLGADQPVYGLRYAMGTRLTKPIPLPLIEDLAAHYVDELRLIQPRGPYFLMGHSFGGLVAYEMAQQLSAMGQRVALVMLLDTFFEDEPKPLPLSDKIAVLSSLTPRQLTRKLWDRVRWQIGLERRIQRFRYGSGYLPHVYTEYQTAAARRAYSVKPYSGRVAFLAASDRQAKLFHTIAPAEQRWREMVSGPFEVHEVPGSHNGILKTPNVGILADTLRVLMDQALDDLSTDQA